MKNLFTLLFILLSISLSAQKEGPKPSFVVTIDGKEYTIAQGEELKHNESAITVKMADYLVFDNEAISFKYPNDFGYEFEEDFGYKGWTLDGNNFVVMLFEMSAKTPLDDFVNGMVSQFGKKNCEVEKMEMDLGKKQLMGKRINVSIVGQNLTVDFMEIPSSDFKSRFIAFQDSKNEDGSASAESKKAYDIINGSIKFK